MARAHYNLAVAYGGRQEREKATCHLERTISLDPLIPDSYSALGMLRFDEERFEEAVGLLETAVAINPRFAEAHFNLGRVLQQMGEYDRSLDCYGSAMAINPDFAPAHWLYALSLPMIYDHPGQIEAARRRFGSHLDRLIDSLVLETPSQIRYAVAGISSATNFYLQYQGGNDLDLQKRYGGLVHAALTARFPRWRSRPEMPPRPPNGKLRIGYATSFMYRHTVGAFLAGWVENHNRDGLEIYCYHTGHRTDRLTDHLKRSSHRFRHLPADVGTVASAIAEDRLHILVYPEIGMNATTMQLAALRLAPVQCCWWGHPVTTGLPSMDYFLTSDLMEPDGAKSHYSEQLVRLPNLSLCYKRPHLPRNPKTRASLDLPEKRFIFLSSQSIFKYLPSHDEIYPRIALQAPNAFFAFIAHQSRWVTERFRIRLRHAFERYGLDMDQFCRFCPRLDADDFMSLNLACDILLDTFGWSGGKTTLEAISCDLPVVTCPGRFMRARHAYAMLTMMGVTETVATDADHYCRIAVRLATNPSHYAAVKTRFAENRHKLYDDYDFISELERFYASLVNGSHAPIKGETGAEGR
jgi:predicted O-linked N-acetylglucosamine transferase (SPINDLY family)